MRPRRGPITWPFLILAAAIAIIAPDATARAADDERPWQAQILIEKWLDADGRLGTDDDRGPAGPDRRFALHVVGAGDEPTIVATDGHGRAEAWMRVRTATAQVEVSELTTGAMLLGVYALAAREDPRPLPVADGIVTVDVYRDTDILPWLAFVNVGTTGRSVEVAIQARIDRDGDLDTNDWALGTGWTYDVSVSGAASVDRATVGTGADGQGGSFVIAMTEPATILTITQWMPDGYTLLDAFGAGSDGVPTGTLEGQTLTLHIDAKVDDLEVVFVNRQTTPAPTATPRGTVDGATGRSMTSLPPTDQVATTTRPGAPIGAVLAASLLGLATVAVTAWRRRPAG